MCAVVDGTLCEMTSTSLVYTRRPESMERLSQRRVGIVDRMTLGHGRGRAQSRYP
jgi:hypothetical protein